MITSFSYFCSSVLAYSIILGVGEKDLAFHTNHCLHLGIPEGWG